MTSKIRLIPGSGTFITIMMMLVVFAFSACGGSSEVTLTAPDAPGTATITARNTRLLLSWTEVDGATGYEVWYNTANDSTPAIQSSADINVTSHAITGLTNGTSYYVWLKAKNSAGRSGFGPGASGIPVMTFQDAAIPGEAVTVTAGSETSMMIYANNQTSITFPTGTDDFGTATVTGKFFIGETQMTNALFAKVFQWAYDHNRFSSTVSDHNGIDSTTAKHGGQQLIDLDNSTCRINYSGGSFTVDSGYENHPVVYVSWYGAIIFCNWLTEMIDGNINNLVYSGIDQTWDSTETAEDTSKKGYRLPSGDEYEYSARYRGDDPTNTVSGYSDPYFTKGNSASGAYTYYNDVNDTNLANGVVDGKDANDQVAIYFTYWDGDSWEYAGGATALAAVGTRTANALGLFDMSGNIWQWCFTKFIEGNNRILRGGGGYNYEANFLQVGYTVNSAPANSGDNVGFRIARTQ